MVSPENRFERHPRITLFCLLLFVLLLSLAAAELVLERTTGLGNPLLYERRPYCAYRPRPNQQIHRFFGANLRINNLGLRAQEDWDPDRRNKILFLGDSVTFGGNHLNNRELFSEIAVEGLSPYESGNAGVPGWGVENVHGLVVKERFLPASIYVSTFIEDDFYRGLARAEVRGDVWYTSPKLALRETGYILWLLFLIRFDLFHAVYGDPNFAGNDPPEVMAEHAAAKLEAMDRFLAAEGFRHLIYLSPTRSQVRGEAERDPLVARLLDRHGLEAICLLDRLGADRATREREEAWFQDEQHLTPPGHRVWGELMRDDLRKMTEP